MGGLQNEQSLFFQVFEALEFSKPSILWKDVFEQISSKQPKNEQSLFFQVFEGLELFPKVPFQ